MERAVEIAGSRRGTGLVGAPEEGGLWARWSGRALWALPLGGLLSGAYWVNDLLSESPDPLKDPVGFAHLSTSAGAMILGDLSMLGAVITLFGVLALNRALAPTGGRMWAVAGMQAAIGALVIVFAIWFLLTVGDAVVGDAVLNGHQDAGVVYASMSGGNWNSRAVPFLVALIATGVVAALCMALAIWKAGGRHSRLLAIGFGLALLFVVAAMPVVTLIGSGLMMVVGSLLARSQWSWVAA